MEDAHTDICDLHKEHDVQFARRDSLPIPSELSFFGVYDGHAGSIAAECAADDIWRMVCESSACLYGETPDEVSCGLIDIFERWDAEFLDRAREERVMDGCAATTVFIRNKELYCANSGDSRTVMCRGGKAVALSIDHKPSRPSELNRVIAAGGRVHSTKMRISELAELDLGPERVWPGGLALSRALGDLSFKEVNELNEKYGIQRMLVVPTPEIHHTVLQPGLDEFIVVACDGLWDVMSSQAVCDFVRTQRALIASSLSPELRPAQADVEVAARIAHSLVQEAFFRNSQDNISVILIIFRDQTTPRAPDEWARLVAIMGELSRDLSTAELGDDAGDLQLTATAQVAIPNLAVDIDEAVACVREAYGSGQEEEIIAAVSDMYALELKPITVYDNPADPANPAMFPDTPPNPPPIEDDYETWGVIMVPQGMVGF